MNSTATGPYRTRYKQLFDDVNEWRLLWKDVVDYIIPERGRFLSNEDTSRNKGKKRRQKIINSTAGEALGMLAAGLQGGLTSPARPWFALGTYDYLMERPAVRQWLFTTRNILLDVLARSNFYDTIHGAYYELGGFGTGVVLCEEDWETVVRYRLFTTGEYLLALDARYRPNALYRKFSLTAIQMKEKFGETNLPDTVKTMLANNQLEKEFIVYHIIQPRGAFDETQAGPAGMPYESVYFEDTSPDQFLRKSGYRSRPFAAARWDFAGTDVYGTCPGTKLLGDVRMLQKMEEKKLRQVDKHVDPPMNAPSSMRDVGGNIIAGGVNYVDVAQGQQSFVPAYQTQADIRPVAAEIDRVETRIRKGFYNDLFVVFLDSTNRKTATEIAAQQEEKLVMLGPVLDRVINELLEPIIGRTYNICESLGLFPPPPPELYGAGMKVEFISTLAQAQKLAGLAPIERVVAFVGNVAEAKPDVLDVIDFDETVNQYALISGAPPRIVRDAEAVQAIREQRQMQQAQMQAMAAGENLTKGAKNLSDAKPNEDNLLSLAMERTGAK